MAEPDIIEQSRKRRTLDKLRIPTQLLEKQHELNLEIRHTQHRLNLEIHKKQSKLLIFSIMATLLAALLGAVVGAYLPTKAQLLYQSQIPITHERIIQQKAAKEKEPDDKKLHK